MKAVPLLVLIGISGVCAQTPVATPPQKSPFENFGNALDQRPPSTRMAQVPSVALLLPRGTSSLSFDAKSVASGGGANINTPKPTNIPKSIAVPAGGNSRTRRSQTVLEVKVRNLSAKPAAAHFDWFFIAEGGKSGDFVWDKGSRPVAVEPGTEQKQMLESSELLETTAQQSVKQRVESVSGTHLYDQYVTQSQKYGFRPAGWIVRMFADGKLIRVQASSGELERMGYDGTAMAALQARPIPQSGPPGVVPQPANVQQ